MKKLLIIGYVWPEPNSSAAGIRMLELVELFLANAYHVTFASAAAPSEHRADLLSLGVAEKAIRLNCSSFDAFIKDLMPDAVLFDRFFSEEQFGWRVERVCPMALRLLDTEDLHSLRNARFQRLKRAQKKIANESERHIVDPVTATNEELYQDMADDDMALREIAAIYRSDLTLIISQAEISLLTENFSVPPHLLHYCPFLNITLPPQSQWPLFSERAYFVAIGNFRHEPNWDAVVYLKQAIWPLIRARLPHAELHIYGAYPPPKATQLDNPTHGFLVKGWADDALSVMQKARVCLAPLRFGAGIKGKLIDAMRAGTPSVTTSIGAEAMTGCLPWGGAVENTALTFAAAAVSLYNDEILWQRSQSQGLRILKEYFFQTDYAQELMTRIKFLDANLVVERQNNFVGAMLRHHSHKSTQYMSQWIEAKNQ